MANPTSRQHNPSATAHLPLGRSHAFVLRRIPVFHGEFRRAPGGHKKVADPTKRIGSAVALGIIPISLLI
jgi:hypothetical protein